MKLLSKITSNWLNKRIPAAQKHKLNHKNIFIFPSKFGALFLALCVLLFLLGTNYQNNLMLLLCYFLLALFLVNLLASYINFARIELHQGKSAQVYVGDNLHLPLWLNAEADLKEAPDGELYFKFRQLDPKQHQAVTKVDVNKYANPISLNYPCSKRGTLTLPRITVTSYFPLGLFRCWTHLAFNNQIIVYPEPIPCKIHLSSNIHSEEDSSVQAGTELTGHDDFSHLKAYQAGEPLHHVAWKQVAKGRGMVSKQFSSVENQIGWLKLATNQSNENLELDISKLTFQVIELSREQQKFGLHLGNTCIAPDVGHAHTQACLTALALFPQSKA